MQKHIILFLKKCKCLFSSNSGILNKAFNLTISNVHSVWYLAVNVPCLGIQQEIHARSKIIQKVYFSEYEHNTIILSHCVLLKTRKIIFYCDCERSVFFWITSFSKISDSLYSYKTPFICVHFFWVIMNTIRILYVTHPEIKINCT